MYRSVLRRLLAVLLLLQAALPVAAAPFAAIVMDARNGEVLHAENADQRLHPASLTKMMTLYLVFEALRDGRLKLDQTVTISANAARQPPSRLGLKAGQEVTVRDLMRAAAIKSANDAATALGEAVAGSEREFARMMTAKAAALGMRNSAFRNANGLDRTGHFSSARDMAILGRRLLYDFPQFYGIFGQTSTMAAGRPIHTTNRLLASYLGADGIKTGYTRLAGYNLVASAERDGRRIIVVVMGGRSSKSRNDRVAALLDLGFGLAPVAVAEVRPERLRDPGVQVSDRPRPRGVVPPNLVETSIAALEEALVPKAAAAELTAATPAPAILVASAAAPERSLRPAARPRLPARTPPAKPPTTRPAAETVWAVQLGAYKDRDYALKTLKRATALKVPALKGAKQSVEATKVNGVTLYRARLIGLTRTKAAAACEGLKRIDAPCRPHAVNR